MVAIEVMKDIFLIKQDFYGDDRGMFTPIWNNKEFKKQTKIDFNPIQLNQSVSKKNVVRGLHFQYYPLGQSKLVSCSNGNIIDVVVDLRIKEKTYGDIYCTELNPHKNEFLFVQKGFGHGFVSLEDNSIVNYLVDEEFSLDYSGVIDPFSIVNVWPIKKEQAIMTDKDRDGINFKEFEGL